ncbi:DUF885 domain-containing protein [Saccharopolyspora sp. CA-218241]|uniref:DUF885 domain-containing protein n=1 Tax=Saccharopolyspora sp. CA-218241 TaxID=3240027 RepID=UPI003D983E00
MSAEVHALCDRYALVDHPALDPIAATEAGLPGFDSLLPDFSPEGFRELALLRRRARRAVERAVPSGPEERLARVVFLERLDVQLRLHEAGLDRCALVDGPVQRIIRVFGMMPTGTEHEWAAVAARMRAVPGALAGVRACLVEAGNSVPPRRVLGLARECEALLTGPGSWFGRRVAEAECGPGLASALRAGAHAAASAFAGFADFLRKELLPRATGRDAVGLDVHRLWSRWFLGAELDPHEAYAWAWAEFRRLEQEAAELVDHLGLGANLRATARALDADPRYRVPSRAALLEWTRRTSSEVAQRLCGTQFDIPDELLVLDCALAPPGTPPGARYTPPTPARPGCLWWSVPEEGSVSLWRKRTTVHHEGVPGHHLQAGALAVDSSRWNAFQRHLCEISGHHEGWASYAERLMHELGFLDDDGYRLGMLGGQCLRAARVVLDLGLHLRLAIPPDAGLDGQRWTPGLAAEFLRTRTGIAEQYVHDEVDRYLGWPGQAPSYKLGERLWWEIRAECARTAGAEFDPVEFHRRALGVGPAGLDVLREAVSRSADAGEWSTHG